MTSRRAGRRRCLTRPRAAKLLGLDLDEVLMRAAIHGLDAIDYDLDDFRRELAGTQ
jgi:hypothetical protein